MDSISDLISNKKFEQGKPIELIKEYLLKNHKCTATIRLYKAIYYINVENASMAANIQMDVVNIMRYAKLEKRPRVNISN